MRHEESRTQSACVRWFRLQYPEYAYMLIAVPNGARTSESQARILKAEGMVAGAADLLLLVPRHDFGCLCLETKTDKGRQSDSQKMWQMQAEKAGNLYAVYRNFDQFRAIVSDYLGENNLSDTERARMELRKVYAKVCREEL